MALLNNLLGLRQHFGLRLLYSVKALPLLKILEIIAPLVDGFSVSSLFEAKLAATVEPETKTRHLCSPGLRSDEVAELNTLCQTISCNSFRQLAQFTRLSPHKTHLGLRVNPQLSLVKDVRFDPCRPHSKLGVPLDELAEINRLNPERCQDINGLHFHSNFSSPSFQPLLKTWEKLEQHLSKMLGQLSWINIGGGYLFDNTEEIRVLSELLNHIKKNYAVEVFFEPGKGVINEAGYLVTSVIDQFMSNGESVVILDTGVNHLPEVFEYQRSPSILEAVEQGAYRHHIYGASCLSGDYFGIYSFNEPLKVGTRLTIPAVGAYTLVKAQRFNGINFPDIYLYRKNGCTELIKRYTYYDYCANWQ